MTINNQSLVSHTLWFLRDTQRCSEGLEWALKCWRLPAQRGDKAIHNNFPLALELNSNTQLSTDSTGWRKTAHHGMSDSLILAWPLIWFLLLLVHMEWRPNLIQYSNLYNILRYAYGAHDADGGELVIALLQLELLNLNSQNSFLQQNKCHLCFCVRNAPRIITYKELVKVCLETCWPNLSLWVNLLRFFKW